MPRCTIGKNEASPWGENKYNINWIGEGLLIFKVTQAGWIQRTAIVAVLNVAVMSAE